MGFRGYLGPVREHPGPQGKTLAHGTPVPRSPQSSSALPREAGHTSPTAGPGPQDLSGPASPTESQASRSPTRSCGVRPRWGEGTALGKNGALETLETIRLLHKGMWVPGRERGGGGIGGRGAGRERGARAGASGPGAPGGPAMPLRPGERGGGSGGRHQAARKAWLGPRPGSWGSVVRGARFSLIWI